MRNIYTGIDLGSDSIKIVVAELIKDKFQVLASASVKSVGIKKGLIVDDEMATRSLNLAVEEIRKVLGTKIDRAIVTIPSNNRNIKVVSGSIDTNGEINGKDIVSVLQNAAENQIPENEELVSIIPIMFNTAEDKFTKNPVGVVADKLTVKALLATAPKKQIYDYLKVFHEVGIAVEDITFNCIGDYFEAKTKETDEELGAIINIGHDKTDVAIFNKGIVIKDSIFNLGSKNVDNDITYIYGTDTSTSRELKERFALASKRYADNNEILEFTLDDGEKKTINQYEITEVVEARITELLKLAKKEINDLTKRKISYIIVTGGITELVGFSYVVENVLGTNATTLNMTTMGIRSNKFSSAIGIIKYFHEKMKLREKNISLIDDDKIKEIEQSKQSMLDLTDDTFISKIFGYFSDK
ncbi:MAG: cell division protein FtsA [Bacilli bacterium]|nr:cell division protein FtsA [Bacilli bacterium]